MRKHIVFAVALLCVLGVFWQLKHVLGIIYVSGLFAVVLNPVVNRISSISIRNYRPSRVVSVVVLMVVLFGALFLFFWIGLPPVLRDFRNFLTDAPKRLPSLISRLQRIPLANKIGLDGLSAKFESSIGTVATYVVASLPKWAEHLLDILTAVILTIYFILEGSEVYDFFLSLVVPQSRKRLAGTLLVAEERVSRWLIGQLALMASVAAYSLIAFRLINIRYVILLGLLMGITNIIPVAGNLVTIVLVALIAASDSWAKAGFVILAYLLYVQFENVFLTPRITKSSVDLMGVSVLIALLCGTAIAGIPGALVAVPTAAIIVVFADEYLIQHEDPERVSLFD